MQKTVRSYHTLIIWGRISSLKIVSMLFSAIIIILYYYYVVVVVVVVVVIIRLKFEEEEVKCFQSDPQLPIYADHSSGYPMYGLIDTLLRSVMLLGLHCVL